MPDCISAMPARKINCVRSVFQLFDGSAFTAGERKGTPVEKFYLPFFENWPAELESHYHYNHVKNKTRKTIIKHALNAHLIERALSQEYKNRFVTVVQEFKRHFEDIRMDSDRISILP